MLSILNRRVITNASMVRPAAATSLIRLYTVVPSTPQQPTSATDTGVKPNDNFNAVHALYNNENQSVHESHYYSSSSGQTYRSLSEDDNHSAFSPTFNSIFDE